MAKKPFIVAVLGYLVPTFALGYTWHLVVFAEQYKSLHIYRDDVIIPFGFLSMLIQGSIFAGAYPRLFSGRGAISGGLRFGALAGLLSWTFTTLATAAKYPMTSVPHFMLIETGFTIAQFSMVGPLVALAWRKA